MKNIEINEIGKYLDAVVGTDINLMFVGDTGIGKTQAIRKYCAKHKIYLKALNLARLEATEALGIPVHNKREYMGKTYDVIEQAIPSWVFDLKDHEDNAMLFLDEFLCAQPDVMNAFLTFITDKVVGDIDLSKIRLVAATNVGIYTFEPDNNILSRFCMLYTENKSFVQYIDKKYQTKIINNYRDETLKENNVIFEERSLKPRCHESLAMLKDLSVLSDLYEGFTNKKYFVYSTIPKVNAIIISTLNLDKDTKINVIAKSLVTSFPRMKNWTRTTNIFQSFTDKTLAVNVFDYINKNLLTTD